MQGDKVRCALNWLKIHNPLYHDITINNSILDSFGDGKQILSVHIQHVLPNDAQDSLTSHYDSNKSSHSKPSADNPSDREQHNHIPFKNVTITDVDARAPANELPAAACDMLKRKVVLTFRYCMMPS